MDEVSFWGGSKVGWVNTGFPLVKLTCSREQLTLGNLGKPCQFTPDQIGRASCRERVCYAV